MKLAEFVACCEICGRELPDGGRLAPIATTPVRLCMRIECHRLAQELDRFALAEGVERDYAREAGGEKGYLICPVCGYRSFNGSYCFDCGYRA